MNQVTIYTQANYPAFLCDKCGQHGDLFRFLTTDTNAVYWICVTCVIEGLNEGRTSYVLGDGQVIGKPLPMIFVDKQPVSNAYTSDDGSVEVDGIEVRFS